MTGATAGLSVSIVLFLLCFSMLAVAFFRENRVGMGIFAGLTTMSLGVALLIAAKLAGIEPKAVTDAYRIFSP